MALVLVVLALAAALCTLAGYRHARRRRAAVGGLREFKPAALAGARVVLSEAALACRWPIALHGKVDKVYELTDQAIVRASPWLQTWG